MQTYKKQSFEDRTFVLEETVFIECQLKNCDLYYSGGDIEMVNTKMENCPFHFRGPARNTAGLLKTFGMLREPNQQQIPAQVTIAGQKVN
jgi:hypothetical protein